MNNNLKMYVCFQSETVSSNSFGKLKIFRHDGNSFGMDCTKIGVFEEWD